VRVDGWGVVGFSRSLTALGKKQFVILWVLALRLWYRLPDGSSSGWFNTTTTGMRRQAANCVQSFELGPLITPLVVKKMTAASPDQRAVYDGAWSGNSQATGLLYLGWIVFYSQW
jgi:hypothetical protein